MSVRVSLYLIKEEGEKLKKRKEGKKEKMTMVKKQKRSLLTKENALL